MIYLINCGDELFNLLGSGIDFDSDIFHANDLHKENYYFFTELSVGMNGRCSRYMRLQPLSLENITKQSLPRTCH